MRSISAAMTQHLAGDVRTLATCCLVTRADGQVFGFTDHDQPIQYNGQIYDSVIGYTASAIEASSDLSTSNMEITALLNGDAILQSDVEAGLWNNAAVLIFVVNYMDLTMGQVNLTSGNFGQFTLQNGSWRVELRGLAQTMQQTIGEQYSPTCRAQFGDSRCLISGGLGPLTFNGTVGSVVTANLAWNDSSLTQAGPSVGFTDTMGKKIPTTTPYTIQIVPPSGSFVSNTSVVDNAGNVWANVSPSAPNADKQYSVNSAGLYTFWNGDAGLEVFINYTYAVGYFSYGKVTWTSGQNKGYSMEVKTFAPGVVTLALPMEYPIAPGDTYTIVAGCDKQFGTCRDRWNNVVHFRGEPYIPGPDVILRPIGS